MATQEQEPKPTLGARLSDAVDHASAKPHLETAWEKLIAGLREKSDLVDNIALMAEIRAHDEDWRSKQLAEIEPIKKEFADFTTGVDVGEHISDFHQLGHIHTDILTLVDTLKNSPLLGFSGIIEFGGKDVISAAMTSAQTLETGFETALQDLKPLLSSFENQFSASQPIKETVNHIKTQFRELHRLLSERQNIKYIPVTPAEPPQSPTPTSVT